MFSESSGTSSMRLVFVLGVLAIIFVWAWLSIEQGVPISFGAMDVGALAVLVGGKDVQKFFETRKG
jgi:hypothetical protein